MQQRQHYKQGSSTVAQAKVTAAAELSSPYAAAAAAQPPAAELTAAHAATTQQAAAHTAAAQLNAAQAATGEAHFTFVSGIGRGSLCLSSLMPLLTPTESMGGPVAGARERAVTSIEEPRRVAHNAHTEAFSLINSALKRLNFKVGEEPLVHQPTWWSLFAARESHAPAREEASGGPDNRVAFPEGRAALLDTVPPIKTFLVHHGLVAAVAVVGALLLPLLHVSGIQRDLLLLWSHGGEKTALFLDCLSLICLLCCCCVAFCWASPLIYMAFRRQNKAVLRHCRCAPLDAQHASLHPVHPPRPLDPDRDQNSHSHKHHTQLVLVLMNPASGAGSAIQQYQQTIVPLLERGGDRLLLPLVLDGGSADFLFLFLFAFAPLFSCCLLLGGDGTYNTITNLMMKIGAAQRGERPASSPQPSSGAAAAATAAAAAAAGLRLGEQARSALTGRLLMPAGGQDEDGGFSGAAEIVDFDESSEDAMSDVETAPTTRKNSRRSVFPDTLMMRRRSSSTSGRSRSRRRRNSRSRRIQNHIAERDEHHRLALTPVPLGTSNTWCSEFLFSEGGRAAGQQYIADMQAEIEEMKVVLGNCGEAADSAPAGIIGGDTRNLGQETAAARSQQQAAAGDLFEGAAKFEADEEVWEQRILEEEESVGDRDRAAAAAARVARLHSKAAADRETDEKRKLPFLFAAAAALMVEKRLLHPQAEKEKERKKENSRQHLEQQLAKATQQLEGLSSFVAGIGPGRDSNLTKKGVGGMLQFWCRRVAEGQSTFTSILKVQTGIHTNYCVNNLEFGYLGTCMVHSEDLRGYGHLRYLLAPLYQIVKMKKQHLVINATLANGTQIKREGEYLAVAVDLVQHWTDDVCATPWAQLNSHYAWLLLIDAGVSRPLLLAYGRNLHQLGPDCPGIERLPVKKVSLQMEEGGVFGLDGEVYKHEGHLTLEVLPDAARVVVSRHDVEKAEAASHPEWASEHFEVVQGA
ncbi:hypothetical protein Emed_004452 [Eimeria media]